MKLANVRNEISRSPEEVDHERFVAVVSRAWNDAEFKLQLMADPARILADYGVEFGARTEVVVVANSPSRTYLVIPEPPTDSEELDDAIQVISQAWRERSTGYGTCPSWHPSCSPTAQPCNE